MRCAADDQRCASPLAALLSERAGQDEPLDAPCGDTIRRALRNTGRSELSGVEVAVAASAVTLLGQVPTFYLRQLAIETVRRAAQNCLIHDQIEVDL